MTQNKSSACLKLRIAVLKTSDIASSSLVHRNQRSSAHRDGAARKILRLSGEVMMALDSVSSLARISSAELGRALLRLRDRFRHWSRRYFRSLREVGFTPPLDLKDLGYPAELAAERPNDF
jgi:hypothetical protein